MGKLMNTDRSKQKLVLLITLASFFLIVLGMKFSCTKGNFGNPKQCPTATVEDIAKQKLSVEQHIQDLSLSVTVIILALAFKELLPVFRFLVPVTEHIPLQQNLLPDKSSPRAPPLVFS